MSLCSGVQKKISLVLTFEKLAVMIGDAYIIRLAGFVCVILAVWRVLQL